MKYFSEFIQKLIRSSIHHYQSIHQVSKALASVVFEILADKGKVPKFTKGHEIFFRIYSKVNQVINLPFPINSPSFKALAPTVFEIFC